MGPIRASRSMSKHFYERERHDKEVVNTSKSRVKKRKLSDVLDTRWSNEELKQFYEAFRRIGTNWKKVAGAMLNRTVDMVGSLYNLNKAYLSLPEGTATVDGFLAMMNDHYNNNLDGNDSNHERDGASDVFPKRARGKYRPGNSEVFNGHHSEEMQNCSASPSYRSLPKTFVEGQFAVNWPLIVGKRTPRIAVIVNQVSLLIDKSQGQLRLETGSPGKCELIQSVQVKSAAVEKATFNGIHTEQDGSCLGGILGGTKVTDGASGRDTRLGIGYVHQSETQCKVKRLQERRPKDPQKIRRKSTVIGEPLKKKRLYMRSSENKTYNEASERKIVELSQSQKQKNRKRFSRGECAVLGHLQMLADVSSNIFSQNCDVISESPGAWDKEKNEKDVFLNNPSSPSDSSAKSGNSNLEISVQGEKNHSPSVNYKPKIPGPLLATSKSGNSKIIVDSSVERSLTLEAGIHSEEVKLRGTVSEEFTIEDAFDEAKQENFRDIPRLQQSFTADRLNSEVDASNNSSWEVCRKNEDIICLPLDPGENMPGDAIIQNVIADELCNRFSGQNSDWCLKECEMGDSTNLANSLEDPHEPVDTDLCGAFVFSPSHAACGTSLSPLSEFTSIASENRRTIKGTTSEDVAGTRHSVDSKTGLEAQIQSRDQDIKAIDELTRALDKKEAVVKELRDMNNYFFGKSSGGEPTPDFEYAMDSFNALVILLNVVNNSVHSAVYNLRQRNTYDKNSAPQSFRLSENSVKYRGPAGAATTEFLVNQDSASQVVEIMTTSKKKAKTMVDAAVRAISSPEEGEDAHTKITEALDSVDNRWYNSTSLGASYYCPYPSHRRSSSLSQDLPWMSYPKPTLDAAHPGTGVFSSNDAQLPLELISDCVATVLMIQDTSDRRYPPAEVARVLELAVESLRPMCSQNRSVYKDIVRCMGYIKAQMLSLVPAPKMSVPRKKISLTNLIATEVT